MNKKAPGKNFLKIVGIILVVFGVLGLFTAAINITILGQMSGNNMDPAMSEMIAQMGLTKEMYQAAVILSVVQAVLYTSAGILGIINCNKVERANICFVCGILMLVYVLASAAYNAVSGAFSFTFVFGLILPLLYFWGALKNKQAAADGENGQL